ncbi:MAG TPA: substrate-binding domain-containing protein, partial [Candidatus Brachybacterium intestinipullorum]|nr:substrate-binding domain-containing protein [Candidatus Brachybacterium intestinipullorum]
VSWDDSLIAEVASPSITALAREPFAMGRSGGDLLVRRIEGTASRGERMQTAPAGLVPRASTARP